LYVDEGRRASSGYPCIGEKTLRRHIPKSFISSCRGARSTVRCGSNAFASSGAIEEPSPRTTHLGCEPVGLREPAGLHNGNDGCHNDELREASQPATFVCRYRGHGCYHRRSRRKPLVTRNDQDGGMPPISLPFKPTGRPSGPATGLSDDPVAPSVTSPDSFKTPNVHFAQRTNRGSLRG